MSGIDRMALATMANGALEELFKHELDKVVENIVDPNTSEKAKRKITLEIEFKPTDDNRDLIGVEIKTKTSLAPTNGVQTKMVLGLDGDVVVAGEYSNQIKGQLRVDEETGEIVETNAFANNVKAFRAQ